MKRQPRVWAGWVLSAALGGLLVSMIRVDWDSIWPTSRLLGRLSETALDPAQTVVHILIPEHPPAGTCMVWLPDGALEFVTSCGCNGPPQPL